MNYFNKLIGSLHNVLKEVMTNTINFFCPSSSTFIIYSIKIQVPTHAIYMLHSMKYSFSCKRHFSQTSQAK